MTAIDKALGISPQVLALRTQRMNLLSSNIANVDTPGYKSRDIDFAVALRQAEQTQGRFERTHAAHIALSGSVDQPDVMYRLPAEVSPDGNSVDPTTGASGVHGERAEIPGQPATARQPN